jgi:hypothetical protein
VVAITPTLPEPQSDQAGQVKHNMAASGLGFISRTAIPAAIGVSLLSASLYDVKGGTRAVIFDRLAGVKETVANEGTHFLVPWLQRAIIFDVRTKPRMIATTTGSKDLQMVSLTLRVLHRPDVQSLPKIYQVRKLFCMLSSISTHLLTCASLCSPSAKTTTSECCPPSEMRCSSQSWLSSTRQS